MLDCSDILPPDSSFPEWQGQMLTAMGGSQRSVLVRQFLRCCSNLRVFHPISVVPQNCHCMDMPAPESTCTGQEPAALSA